MGNFIDFNDQIGEMRSAIATEIDKLFVGNKPGSTTIYCALEGLSIATNEGSVDVNTIWLDESRMGLYNTRIMTTEGEIWDIMELETDDMVAIYEHVWYQLKEK